MPSTLSMLFSYTGKRDRPLSVMVCNISSSVERMSMAVMSLRWIMQSPASMLLNSKMFSIISRSSASMAPFSSPMSTICMMSSSVTASPASAGLM